MQNKLIAILAEISHSCFIIVIIIIFFTLGSHDPKGGLKIRKIYKKL